MELKLAKTELLSTKSVKITLEKINEEMDKSNQKIYYFDKENAHKDMNSLVKFFEDKGLNVYLREVKFGLDEAEYVYEVHIIK